MLRRAVVAPAQQGNAPTQRSVLSIQRSIAPAQRSIASPGTPTGYKATLNPNGSIDMSWLCPNSGVAGIMYMIARRTGATGDFVTLGGTGDRKFTDESIPPGTSQVTYSIQAVRSAAVGQPAELVVNFGANGLVSPMAVPVKLAA